MPELGPYGSVRGARGSSRPYRESGRHQIETTLLDPKLTWTSGDVRFAPLSGKCRHRNAP